MLNPFPGPVGSGWMWKAAVLDYLAVFGVVAGVVAAAILAWRWQNGPLGFAIWVFALGAAFVAKPDVWADAYAFGRTQSPLLICVALWGLARGFWWGLGPILLVIPRIAFQFGPQARGIVRAILHGA
jgi:hypothetical protein